MFGKTSFKISGSVGIIILLLGITILFGLYQMAKVSDQIVTISQAYEPLQNKLHDIKFYQSNQLDYLGKIKSVSYGSDEYRKAVEEFWSSSVIIKSNIQQAKRLAETGSTVATTASIETNLISTRQSFVEIEQSYDEIERLISEAISSQDDQFLLAQIEVKNQQLMTEIDETSNEIKAFNEESVSSIEGYEQGWLSIQIAIIIVVGGIAIFLRRFINQINTDLKNEIQIKTSELQEANKKLQDLDRKKDEFISIASHELKSPIQPIFGFAELAKAGDIDQKEAWDGVTTLAKKLQDLTTDVLDVTRIESNRLSLFRQKFFVNDVIAETVKMLRTGISKDIRIVEDLDENIELNADKQRVEQVLRNIIANAVKFTSKGMITVRTRLDKETSELVFSVSDTGLGIPEEILPSIFEKFVTKSHGLENSSGNGLGLFLCKGIVNAHGGRIRAYNNPDCGATFEFSLPLIQKEIISFTN
ncbi:MAG TPA: HAMP domain-containing sensor histidine kinase [Candidatus Nitrosotenuis sp.]|nr:HAMP domain-containing sensor histidine kinase [Candidatus Nitrosotenuis sp.]